MARVKEHPVTQILNLIEALSTDEKRIIFDKVRPAPKPRSKSKPERNPSQKRKAGKVTFTSTDSDLSPDGPTEAICANCQRHFNNNVHHLPTHPNYHEFVEPAGEGKGASV